MSILKIKSMVNPDLPVVERHPKPLTWYHEQTEEGLVGRLLFCTCFLVGEQAGVFQDSDGNLIEVPPGSLLVEHDQNMR